MSIAIQLKPKLLTWRRWPIFCTISIAAGCVLLFVFGEGGDGTTYWSFAVPAFILGSAACQYTFLAINVFVITSVPPERAGVAGGLMSVVMQLGNALGLAIQAACLTHDEGPEMQWTSYARGYWAVFGWMVGSIVISGMGLVHELKGERGLQETLTDDALYKP
jgi:MFS family permease